MQAKAIATGQLGRYLWLAQPGRKPSLHQPLNERPWYFWWGSVQLRDGYGAGSMHRSPRVTSALAAIILAVVLAPVAAPAPTGAAGECGTHRSETVPPPTIRVYRTVSGAVDTVDFGTYVKNVLSREWISSWTTESLRSGALAVKNYAWYQVIHWRGYLNGAGTCFDVFDSTRDQHYDPSRPTYAAMAAAVDATWATLAHREGRIFATYYNAGQPYEGCGAGANGWQMFQWGTQACGLDGMTAAQIMAIYYPGVMVSAAPPAATPPPATPAPTPAPAPTALPSAAPGPTPPSSPTPAPTPEPPPQPPVAMPGGGQVGLVAPPPPPPPDPEPIVMSVGSGLAPTIEVTAAGAPAPISTSVDIAEMGGHAAVRFERMVDAASNRSVVTPVTSMPATLRLLVMRQVIEGALANLSMRSDPGS